MQRERPEGFGAKQTRVRVRRNTPQLERRALSGGGAVSGEPLGGRSLSSVLSNAHVRTIRCLIPLSLRSDIHENIAPALDLPAPRDRTLRICASLLTAITAAYVDPAII